MTTYDWKKYDKYNEKTEVVPSYSPNKGYTDSAWQQKKLCTYHTGPDWLLSNSHGENLIVADKIFEIERDGRVTFLIDCSESSPRPQNSLKMILPPGFESLQQYLVDAPRIAIPWGDFGAPNLLPQFWQELVAMLPPGVTGIGCAGGHGRTGTALACIRIAACQESAEEAIAVVRKDYCTEAIETQTQKDYIAKVAEVLGFDGKTVKRKGKK